MSPSAAVLQLLEDAVGDFRRRMEELGMTSTIDVRTDRLSGNVEASIQFVVPRKLAERLASKEA